MLVLNSKWIQESSELSDCEEIKIKIIKSRTKSSFTGYCKNSMKISVLKKSAFAQNCQNDLHCYIQVLLKQGLPE